MAISQGEASSVNQSSYFVFDNSFVAQWNKKNLNTQKTSRRTGLHAVLFRSLIIKERSSSQSGPRTIALNTTRWF